MNIMNPLLVTGVCIVLFAFGSYTTAIVTQVRRRRTPAIMRGFLTAGVSLDATATAFMIARVSQNSTYLSRHPGLLGVSPHGSGSFPDVAALSIAKERASADRAFPLFFGRLLLVGRRFCCRHHRGRLGALIH